MAAQVSVVIPVKNREMELLRSVRSVLAQSFEDWEAIIVDDKSDLVDIEALVASLGDTRLHYRLNDKENSNANVCRNIGLEHATGDYIAMLDSDDEWLPGHLTSKLEFQKRTGCDGSFGSAYVDFGFKQGEYISRDLNPGETMADYLFGSGSAYTPTHFYTTRCARAISWDEDLSRYQDLDFSIRFAEKFDFRPSKDSTVKVHWVDRVPNADFKAYDRFIQKHGDKLSPKIFTSYSAHQYEKMRFRDDVTIEEKHRLKKDALSDIRALSYMDYTMLFDTDSVFQKAKCRLTYYARHIFA